MANLQIGGTYNFETLAPAILGDKIKNAKLTAIVNYTMANKLFNPSSQHANIYPHLPPGTARDHTKYSYYVFTSQNGEDRVYALEWLNQNTIELVSGSTIRATIYNTTAQDLTNIRQLLASAGYTSISIDVV